MYINLNLRVPDNLIQNLIKHQDLNSTNKRQFWRKTNKEKNPLSFLLLLNILRTEIFCNYC